MAIWIDDTLSEQDKWADLSSDAKAALVELWMFCKRARNDGAFRANRLYKASEALTPSAEVELRDKGWLHDGGRGCGTDTCPKGVVGYVVMHDFLQHQESSREMASRIDSRRELSKKGNHTKWHTNRGVFEPTCKFCQDERDAKEQAG